MSLNRFGVLLARIGSRPTLLIAVALTCGLATPASAAISCSLSVTNAAFGSLSLLNLVLGSAADTTATATISCSGGSANTSYIFCVSLYNGSYPSGTQRNMGQGSLTLPYGLYTDAAYSVPWGSYQAAYLSGGYQTVLTTGATGGILQPLTIYAQIPSGTQPSTTGFYSDTLGSSPNQVLQYAINNGTAGNTACPLTGAGMASSPFAFSVTATVSAGCSVQHGTLTFPAASGLSSAVTAVGSLGVQCTNSTPYSVSLDLGSYASAGQRRMYSAATSAYVSYNLYTDAADTSPWSVTTSAATCTNGAGSCYLGTGSGTSQSIPIYGQVPPQGTPAPGLYSDVVTVTATY